jgi:hypothetical protein
VSRLVRVVTVLGLFIVVSTELLSAMQRLDRISVVACWLVFACTGGWLLARSRMNGNAWPRPKGAVEWLIILCLTLIATVNLALAIFTAPNAWDAVTYHLPRISHWIANKSVAHYPTHIDRQLWISPGHEFFALHLELLIGTNRLVNIVQWLASVGSAAVAAGIAGKLGGGRKSALFAALFAMSLPMSVAQASGSQVDLFAAFWVAVTVYMLLGVAESGTNLRLGDAVLTGGAAGLAILAKTTSVLALLPFALWITLVVVRRSPARGARLTLAALAVVLLVNSGHLLRNQRTFGNPFLNPLGASLVNDYFGPDVTASNILRNATLHTATRWTLLNAPQQSVVEGLHRAMGLDPSDPATTFLGGQYRVVRRARSEVFAGAGIHVAVGIVLLLLARRGGQSRPYGLLLVAGLILFCTILKWQPWHARLHLSWLILFAPLVAVAAERSRMRYSHVAAAMIVFVAGLPMLFRNAARPVLTKESVFEMPRERQYFSLLHWIYEPTVRAAQFLADNRCSRVGLLTSWGDPEETLREAMRNRSRGRVEIHHVGIPPDRYPPARSIPGTRVCALVAQYAFPGGSGRPLPVPPGFSLALDEGMVRVYLPDSSVPR